MDARKILDSNVTRGRARGAGMIDEHHFRILTPTLMEHVPVRNPAALVLQDDVALLAYGA